MAEVAYGSDGATVAIDGVAPATDAAAVDAGDAVYVLRHGRQTKVSLRDLTLDEAGDQGQGGLVRAPMHGKVLSVLVEQGVRVRRGQRLAIIEAMKMENEILAPRDCVVGEVHVEVNQSVKTGEPLLRME